MKLLVIGGTGVLSGAVVREAISQNIETTIIVRGQKKREVPQGAKVIKADYRSKEIVKLQLEGLHFDAVIDFLCFTTSDIAYSIDLLSPFAKQYIFISTACVYDTSIPGEKDEESEKVLKTWNYSINKWDCECLLRDIAAKKSINYSIVRPCITYDDTRIPYGIMPPYGYHWTLCARMLAKKPILRWDGGTTRWNMMRVEDFAVGVVGLIGNPNAYGEAYNISGDSAYSWNEVIDAVSAEIGVKPIFFDLTSEEYAQSYPNKKGEISGRSFDAIVSNKKIKSLVPTFQTNYDLKFGIAKTISAINEQNYQLGIDWSFDAETDRIIQSWCKKKNIDSKQYNLRFVDYLGRSTKADRRVYKSVLYQKSIYFIIKNKLHSLYIKTKRCILK